MDLSTDLTFDARDINYTKEGCKGFHALPNSSDHCAFALDPTNGCGAVGCFIEYTEKALCNDGWSDPETFDGSFILFNVFYTLWCLYLCFCLGLAADAFFVPTLTKMATQLQLSDSVAGVTLVAFGGGAADIFASIVAFTNPDPEVAKLAIGSLLGAGMFVIMIVAGACMIAVDFTPAARNDSSNFSITVKNDSLTIR